MWGVMLDIMNNVLNEICSKNDNEHRDLYEEKALDHMISGIKNLG